MPDNVSGGMLETLVQRLVPSGQSPLLTYARQAVAEARQRNAPFKEAHLAKAEIHTWLAWQNPPGRQLHEAVRDRVLDCSGPLAQPFLTWFMTLYRLQSPNAAAPAP
jgi:hypothetical protein